MAYTSSIPAAGVSVVATTVVFMTISTAAVGLRIYAARLRRRSFHLHDYLSFAALVWWHPALWRNLLKDASDMCPGFLCKRYRRWVMHNIIRLEIEMLIDVRRVPRRDGPACCNNPGRPKSRTRNFDL